VRVEDTPRIEIEELWKLSSWEELRHAPRVTLDLDDGGRRRTLTVELARDESRDRTLLKCPECGAHRKHLYLHDREIACRRCHRLLYFEQSLGQCRWKSEVAIPVLRAANRQRGYGWMKKTIVSSQAAESLHP